MDATIATAYSWFCNFINFLFPGLISFYIERLIPSHTLTAFHFSEPYSNRTFLIVMSYLLLTCSLKNE